MAFEAATLALLEDALAEAFQHHNQLDDFLRRVGVAPSALQAARDDADARARKSSREYARAPKRFVVQALINQLQGSGETGDRLFADLVTQVTAGKIPSASPTAHAAIGALVEQIEVDRRRKAEDREERERVKRATEEARAAERGTIRQKKEVVRSDLLEAFMMLIRAPDPQRRGYMLEMFLNDLFAFEELAPRGSFRNIGEQIDGSFVWRDNVFLVEAKWQTDPIAGSDFGAFIYKLEGKSADTRGLYISINGYTKPAIESLRRKGEARFFCIDGAHIVRALQPAQRLSELLSAAWRCAAETGEAYLPVSRMAGSN